MGAHGKIVDLRQLLAERFPSSRCTASARLETGLAPLDAALEGGLPQGAITELTSPNLSAGSAGLIYQLLQAAVQERYGVALIDGRDSFDPQPLGQARLRQLLWVRCQKAADAVKAADLLLRDGNFPLVLLDLILNPLEELRKIPSASWYRLQRLVEPAPTALLVLTRRSIISSAHWKLTLEHSWQLADLTQENNVTPWQFTVQRGHGARPELAETG